MSIAFIVPRTIRQLFSLIDPGKNSDMHNFVALTGKANLDPSEVACPDLPCRANMSLFKAVFFSFMCVLHRTVLVDESEEASFADQLSQFYTSNGVHSSRPQDN